MERMKKPKFIKEIEKSEGKERAKCGRWYIRVYGELDNKPMVELESLEIIVKELHKLEKENRKLRFELGESQTHRWVDVKDLKNKVEHQKSALKSMEKQIKELKADLEHMDSFFSIMRDVLANEEIDNTQLAAILYTVVHEECGDYDLSKPELKIAKEFWERKYV